MDLRRIAVPLSAAALAWFAALPCAAASGSPDRGERVARAMCAGCHAVGHEAASPMPGAPRFADITRDYPGQTVETVLADGLMTPHPPMPTFLTTAQAAADLQAYIASIQDRSQTSPPQAPPRETPSKRTTP